MADLYLSSPTQSRYTPNVGKVDEGTNVFCGVCKSQMTFRRAYGPKGFAQALAGSKSHYDEFICPERAQLWHRQVIALWEQYEKSVSKQIRQLLMQEIESVLYSRKTTIPESELKDSLAERHQ